MLSAMAFGKLRWPVLAAFQPITPKKESRIPMGGVHGCPSSVLQPHCHEKEGPQGQVIRAPCSRQRAVFTIFGVCLNWEVVETQIHSAW